MLTRERLSKSNEAVAKLMDVRSLFYESVGISSFDTVPADPEAIELVDALIHRVLSNLTDLAARGE